MANTLGLFAPPGRTHSPWVQNLLELNFLGGRGGWQRQHKIKDLAMFGAFCREPRTHSVPSCRHTLDEGNEVNHVKSRTRATLHEWC